jgi:hypothetical protein
MKMTCSQAEGGSSRHPLMLVSRDQMRVGRFPLPPGTSRRMNLSNPKSDKAKGKIKKAAGSVTGNEKLKTMMPMAPGCSRDGFGFGLYPETRPGFPP